MRINSLIRQLQGLKESGETDVIVAYYDRFYWNELEEDHKLCKDDWIGACEITDYDYDYSSFQEELGSFIKDKMEDEDG